MSRLKLTRSFRAALPSGGGMNLGCLPLIAVDVEVVAIHSCQHKQNEPCLLITSA